MSRVRTNSTFGTTRIEPSSVKKRLERRPISTVTPDSPLARAMRSPTRNGRSAIRMKPEIIFESVSCAAKAKAKEEIPATAKSPLISILKWSKITSIAKKKMTPFKIRLNRVTNCVSNLVWVRADNSWEYQRIPAAIRR